MEMVAIWNMLQYVPMVRFAMNTLKAGVFGTYL
jgi:hypothetical protein